MFIAILFIFLASAWAAEVDIVNNLRGNIVARDIVRAPRQRNLATGEVPMTTSVWISGLTQTDFKDHESYVHGIKLAFQNVLALTSTQFRHIRIDKDTTQSNGVRIVAIYCKNPGALDASAFVDSESYLLLSSLSSGAFSTAFVNGIHTMTPALTPTYGTISFMPVGTSAIPTRFDHC